MTQCAVHNHNNFTLKLQKLLDETVCFQVHFSVSTTIAVRSLHVLAVRISTVQHKTDIICKTLTAFCHFCCL
jgi:hypothetical protein